MRPIFRAQNAVFKTIPAAFSFDIAADAKTAVYGPLKWNLLEIIAGRVPDPHKRISFPGIGRDLWPSQAIELTKFGQDSSSSAQAPFVGARYESFRDEFDVSLRTFLETKAPQGTSSEEIGKVADHMDLTKYLDNWVVGLSNGQSRRAQLALALLRKPRFLVMDEPFLGLDPTNRAKFAEILRQLAIPVVIGLRDGEHMPSWITQLLYASREGVAEGDEARVIVERNEKEAESAQEHRKKKAEERQVELNKKKSVPIIEMKGITLKYPGAESPLFKDLHLKVHSGERVHISGPNGSGKSTLLALITADHPQSWSNNVFLFGEALEVGKHSYFSINKQIGHTSPELHAIFPKRLNARRAISTGFSGTMIPPSELTAEQEKKLESVAQDLGIDLTDTATPFGEMPLSEQKLVLFARALVKDPKILILDEAFSTLSGSQMDLAFKALDKFEGAVLVVGHIESEIPICDKKLSL